MGRMPNDVGWWARRGNSHPYLIKRGLFTKNGGDGRRKGGRAGPDIDFTAAKSFISVWMQLW
jgi:hypothetical protein